MPYRPLNDTELPRPQFLILKASAGSGKTYEITRRFVQLYLSDKISKTALANIIAITFSNNAANEMKERIFEWLKGAALKDHNCLKGLREVVSMEPDELATKAHQKIEELLDNYQDLRVRTIDSLMTGLYKATSIEEGLNEAFEVSFEKETLFGYAFDLFLRKLTDNDNLKKQLYETIDKISEHKTTYVWDPIQMLKEHFIGLFEKLSSFGLSPSEIHTQQSIEKSLIDRTWQLAKELREIASKYNLPLNGRTTWPQKLQEAELHNDLKTLIEAPGSKFPYRCNDPVVYEQAIKVFQKFMDTLSALTYQWSYSYWNPYINTYLAMEQTLEETKRAEGVVFLEDIGLKLSHYINNYEITDLYFFLGETLTHWLIDEFQDTSPVQWKVLAPLIENALSEGGTFMLVGDVKQAIYGYRNADYTIMKQLEQQKIFLSVNPDIETLDFNRRSASEIVEFSKNVFKNLMQLEESKEDKNSVSLLKKAAKEVGLDNIEQVAFDKGRKGYVQVEEVQKDMLTEKLPELVIDIKERGFNYSDIAILAHRNEQIIEAVSILNSADIPVFSYSSLDARKIKIVSEIVNLLKFLDEPVNNTAFAEFILGEIFQNAANISAQSINKFLFRTKDTNRALYKLFQEAFPELWERFFSQLYKVAGYLPLYDLLVYIYQIFEIFERFPDEQAPLIKLLEIVLDLERDGITNIRDFLDKIDSPASDTSMWDIKTIPSEDAVKAMTIHKSKGLEFKVVILLLSPSRSSNEEYYIQKNENSISIFKITKKIASKHPKLKEIYENRDFLEKVNMLNTIYVGLTRAEEQLYVLKLYKEESDLKRFPLNILPQTYSSDSKPYKTSIDRDQKNTILAKPEPFVSLKQPEDIHIHYLEKKRGEEIHAILQQIKYIEDLDRLNEYEFHYLDKDDLKKITETVFALKKYFTNKAMRHIYTEIEFVDSNGRTFRIDRLIIDKDEAVVIEFKTGQPEQEHIAQMDNYISLVKQSYPNKHIKGFLVYIDTMQIQQFPNS